MGENEEIRILVAPAIVLACGGCGQVYYSTVNISDSTGDGLAMAYRSGIVLKDLEFVQFHPTALAINHINRPELLISESVRGEGGKLINEKGERIMVGQHPQEDLAPRHVVSRVLWRRIMDGERIFLDLHHLNQNFLKKRFPSIYQEIKKFGIDIKKEPVQVSPAAHYLMGGIATNIWGETSVLGVYAVGEVACTGVHGANRLASNSLAEALVYGARVAERVFEYTTSHPTPNSTENIRENLSKFKVYGLKCGEKHVVDLNKIRLKIQKIMWENVGIIRSEKKLTVALRDLNYCQQKLEQNPSLSKEYIETLNLLLTAQLMSNAALERRESRGSHFRSDYPKKDQLWRKHIYFVNKPKKWSKR